MFFSIQRVLQQLSDVRILRNRPRQFCDLTARQEVCELVVLLEGVGDFVGEGDAGL